MLIGDTAFIESFMVDNTVCKTTPNCSHEKVLDKIKYVPNRYMHMHMHKSHLTRNKKRRKKQTNVC